MQCLRDPLVPIYCMCPRPALRLASAIFEWVYSEKIEVTVRKQVYEEKVHWENVLCALVSGILVSKTSLRETGTCS